MYINLYKILLFIICIQGVVSSQVDSSSVVQDTLSRDTMPLPASESLPKYILSPDALEYNIKYGATDSTKMYLKSKSIELFGRAYVEYENYKLNAGYIFIDFETSEAFAKNITDSYGNPLEKPMFSDGNQSALSNSLRFNFKTKQGLSVDSRLKEGEFFIHGERTKYVRNDKGRDTLNNIENVKDLIFQKDAIITTCNHDHPHYGIRARRIKIIPNKVAVLGLSQLVIAGVPTPLILPFGLFPLVKGQSSGLIFPRTYQYDQELGFGLRGIGYYFPINDYFDLTLTGDIYTRGTHRVNLSSDFKKRYRYNGNVEFEYANNIIEDANTGKINSNKTFGINLRWNQDAKAHPYKSFGGSARIDFNQHNQTNYTNYDARYNNKLQSNLYFRNSMPWSPFSFGIGMTHSQDVERHTFSMTLPDIQLNMNQISPFKNNERVGGEERFYEKIRLSYNASLKNVVNTVDTLLFSQETLDKMTVGFTQKSTLNANYKALKYIDISPRATYDQILLNKRNTRYLDPTPVVDTLSSSVNQDGETIYVVDSSYVVRDKYDLGIYNYHKFSAGIDLSTQIFGTWIRNKGWFRGVRHTMRPRVGLSYSTPTDFYEDRVAKNLDPTSSEDYLMYNPYSGLGYSTGLNERQLSITYSLGNSIEAKYYSQKDKQAKKFFIFRQLGASGSYNLARDSLRLSNLSVNGSTEIIPRFVNLRLGASFSYYMMENGRRVDKTLISQGKFPVQFDNMSMTVSTGFTVGQVLDIFRDKKDHATSEDKASTDRSVRKSGQARLLDKVSGYSSFFDYIEDFRIDHRYSLQARKLSTGKDTLYTSSNYIGARGTVPLTKNWKLNVDHFGYDLKTGKFVYPSFAITRDLHCWNMNFSWQPSAGAYSFFIGVKSTSLSFLKYNYGQRSVGNLLGR